MNGKEFRVKMRGKVQVEDVTANEGTKAKPTEMLFNFCGLQLSCPFSWSHLSACVCVCVCVSICQDGPFVVLERGIYVYLWL